MDYKEKTNINFTNNSELIKSKERVINHGEVLTPEWLVNDMLDLIPKSACKINSRYLETSVGEGAFLVEVLRRKLNIIFNMYSEVSDREYYTIVAICNIYGLEILKDNVEITRKRLLMLIQEFFIKKNNINVNNSFFDIVKMILDINIINMDSMKFREPIFDDNNQIIVDEKGEFIYKNEFSLISEWDFNTDKKEVKRTEYYYKDVVNKQKEEYILNSRQKILNENIIDENTTNDNHNNGEYQEIVEQLSLFASLSTNTETEVEEKNDNTNKIILNPIREFKSVYYLNLLD